MSVLKEELRDFVYLDWERVRSIAAQVLHGIPNDVTKQKSSETGIEGKLEGNAFNVIKGKTGVDYRYFKTESETSSLHHYIYSLVESKLNKRIVTIDNNFDFNKWTDSYFKDGQFVKMQGLIRFLDYGNITGMMQYLPKLLETTQYFQKLSTSNYDSNNQNALRKEQHSQMQQIKSLKMDKMSEIIEKFYGDAVRIKILPIKDYKDKVFVGTGKLANFYDTASSLSQKYGYEIDAGWTTIGQINISKENDEPEPIKIGNQMEDAMEEVQLGINGMIKHMGAVSWPAISFTPLSIYRTLN